MADRKFRVIRPHVGDKEYAEGDIRTADPRDVEHLVPKVLEPIEEPKKAPPAPKAAAAKSAPKKPRKR